jgi:hypothetical protein
MTEVIDRKSEFVHAASEASAAEDALPRPHSLGSAASTSISQQDLTQELLSELRFLERARDERVRRESGPRVLATPLRVFNL